MSSGFNETTILECNRLASEEGKTQNNDNPALFTNKIGSGIKLNSGDTISVQSAFVSELGAGADTIQFRGRVLTDNKGHPLSTSLTSIKITGTNACYQDPINNASNNDNQVKYGVPLIEKATQESNLYYLKDNEVNVKLSYYKTRNGECCVALPRRFLSNIPLEADTRPSQWKIEDSVESGLPFTGISKENGGVLVLPRISFASGETGFNASKINRSYFVDDDYVFKKGASLSTDNPSNLPYSYYKLESDNSRYKIFINADDTGVKKAGFLDPRGGAFNNWYIFNEPAESRYLPYDEIFTLTAPIGFSSPESIADNLTNQMRKTGSLTSDTYHEYSHEVSANEDRRVRLQRPISCKTSTPLYKTFNSFSVNNHNASTYFAFYNASFNGSDSDFMYNQYIQNYQFIGIKRPDFYEKGCALAETMPNGSTSAGFYNKFTRLLADINCLGDTSSQNGRFNASITIEHEWTKTNLDAWKGWLDTQGNYPELFSNRNNNYAGITNVNNSRFLHMNLNACSQTRLGGGNVAPLSFTGQVANNNASSQNSVPVFFDFDPSASNTFTNGDEGQACYGFAFKKYNPNDEKYYISFSTSNLFNNGVANASNPYYNSNQTSPVFPYEYANYSGSHTSLGYASGLILGNFTALNGGPSETPNNASGRLVGFDKHFNSYGMAVIGLQDGYLNNDYQFMTHYAVNTLSNNALTLGNAIIDATPFAEKIYLGAQEPKIEYSASNQKFNIQQLHTPEYIGNLWNAGIVSTQAENNTTTNPDAQQKVFKINKRLDNTNWTTDMIPYSQNYASALGSEYPNEGASNGSYTLSRMNDMIAPWTIFDSQSGIFIEDFGIPENAWNKSLWDTLGFSYSQFHAPFSASFNYNTRLDEINKKDMPILTTNSDINAGDTINFMMNIFGAVNLTPQVPLPMLFNGDVGSNQTPPFTANRYPQSYPAITESQNSILVEGDNLPTKMTRAYYTIRSSLLDSATYLGSRDSGEPLKIIGIVNKINGDGDYYFQQDNELTFTITNPKTITEITTSIHDPDGSFAQLNRDSCVIYKVNKVINSTLDPVAELLQATQQK